MAAKRPARAKVFFHRRGRDPESAWCTALEHANNYRVDNILFLHATPICDDVIEARPSRAFDGALAYRRTVKAGGRYAMILDYPATAHLGKLRVFLWDRFQVVGEGCYGPEGGEPGRLYLAVPVRLAPKTLFTAATAEFPGLIAVHPEIRLKGDVAAARKRAPARRVAAAGRRKKQTEKQRDPFDAIHANDKPAMAKISRKDLTRRDVQGRSLLFMAVLEGRAELVKQLLSMGAKPNPAGKERAPLVAAALRNRPREAKLLLEAGAKPQRALDPDGDPVLVTAAFREATPVVRALLKVPHPREHLSLALLEAAGVGNLPITKLLVKHGADPEWVSKRGNSAISVARKKRRRDVVAYLQSLQKK